MATFLHGETPSNSAEYRIWRALKQRGSRQGIPVC